MNDPGQVQRLCPQCGAALPPGTEACGSCQAQPESPAGQSPFAPRRDHAPIQFSLGSMMLLVTLAAVVLGAAAIAPGLGIGLAILAAPALIRTAVVASRQRSAGHPLDLRTKAWIFVGTLGILTVIVTATAAAFVATCFPIGAAAFGADSMGLMGLAWLVGISVAIFSLYVLFRAFRRVWPRGQ